jgi:hypothetical protein
MKERVKEEQGVSSRVPVWKRVKVGRNSLSRDLKLHKEHRYCEVLCKNERMLSGDSTGTLYIKARLQWNALSSIL